MSKIALVNQFDNKFNAIHKKHLELLGHEVAVVIADPKRPQVLADVSKWANVMLTAWTDWTLAYLTAEPRQAKIVTWLRSYETFTPECMTQVQWDRVSGVVYVAEHVRRYTQEAWPHMCLVPSAVVHNGVDLGDYPESLAATPKEPNSIAYLGYLNHKKGVELLAQAVVALPGHTFHIGGAFQEERFRVYWEHFLAENGIKNVLNHGWIEDVPAFLAEKQYIISTSPWEGCPWNVIEALACGVAPLVHNWPGAQELFGNQFVWGTTNTLRYRARYLEPDPQELRGYVAEHFNAVRQNQKLADAIQGFIAKKRVHFVPYGDANSAGTRLRAMEPALLLAEQSDYRVSIGALGPWAAHEVPACTVLQRVYGPEIDPMLDAIREVGGKVILELCDYYPAQETSGHVDAFTTCSQGNVDLFISEGFKCPGLVVDDTLDYGMAHDGMLPHLQGEEPTLCWYGSWGNDYKSGLICQVEHLPGPIYCITGPTDLPAPFVHIPWTLETCLSELHKHHICLLPQILDDPINNAHRAATAWGAGLCVIATDCVEFRKLFEAAGLGEYLCRKPEDWTAALVKLQSREARLAYIAKAQPVALARHGAKAIGGRWLEIINQVIGEQEV